MVRLALKRLTQVTVSLNAIQILFSSSKVMKIVNLCFSKLNCYSDKFYFNRNYALSYVHLKIIPKIFRILKDWIAIKLIINGCSLDT